MSANHAVSGPHQSPGSPGTDPSSPEDSALLAALSGGDLSAMDTLVARHGSRIRSFLGRSVRDDALADDLTQEMFLRVFRKAHTFDPRYPARVWMLRIARNLVVDSSRRTKTRRGAVSGLRETERVKRQGTPPGTPLRSLENRELQSQIDGALDRLAEPFRSVFVLREIEGLSYEDIADVLDTSVKTVSSRLHRARQKLRGLLSGYLHA